MNDRRDTVFLLTREGGPTLRVFSSWRKIIGRVDDLDGERYVTRFPVREEGDLAGWAKERGYTLEILQRAENKEWRNRPTQERTEGDHPR